MNIEIVCSKCGSNPEIIEDQTNQHWITYNTKGLCKCGGNWKVKVKEKNKEGVDNNESKDC